MEDALHATKAAVEEGIVPGGGTAYLRCLRAWIPSRIPLEQKVGVDIVRRSLENRFVKSPPTQGAERFRGGQPRHGQKSGNGGFNAAADAARGHDQVGSQIRQGVALCPAERRQRRGLDTDDRSHDPRSCRKKKKKNLPVTMLVTTRHGRHT